MAICLQADCNTVSKSWKLEKNITTEEFIATLNRSGWGDMVTEDIECSTREGSYSTSGQILCEAEGTRDGFDIHVLARGNHEDNTNSGITLRVRGEL